MIYHAILISVSCHGHPSISQRRPCWQCLLPKASTKRARKGVACPRLSWNNVDTSWTCSPFAALASHLRAQLHSQGKSWFLSNGMVRDNWAAPRSIAQSQSDIFRGLQLAGISLPLCAPKSNCQRPFSKDVPGHSTASSGLVHHGFILQVIHFCYCLQCWETGFATQKSASYFWNQPLFYIFYDPSMTVHSHNRYYTPPIKYEGRPSSFTRESGRHTAPSIRHYPIGTCTLAGTEHLIQRVRLSTWNGQVV